MEYIYETAKFPAVLSKERQQQAALWSAMFEEYFKNGKIEVAHDSHHRLNQVAAMTDTPSEGLDDEFESILLMEDLQALGYNHISSSPELDRALGISH